MSNGSYHLLQVFREAFEGTIYKHRISTTGNRIGRELFEDLLRHAVKQIDRVINDLEGFALRMKRLNKKCINVAVVGVNHEPNYIGFEGTREFRHKLRADEPLVVMNRLGVLATSYDEVLLLPFRATNQPPFPFSWGGPRKAELDYASVLTRIGERYQERFR